MVPRILEHAVQKRLSDHKVIIMYGPHTVGKTTLLKKMFAGKDGVLFLNGDESEVRSIFSDQNLQRLASIIGSHTTVVIDEAQRIDTIGLTLKLIHDSMDHVKLICSGSSSCMLARSLAEPLTGRKWEFHLHPFSFEELAHHRGLLSELQARELRLIYGSYPEVTLNVEDGRALLVELVTSYLYKDILEFELLRKSSKVDDLLKALGYLNLLEQSFVIFRLPSFARTMRNEIKQGRKIYFVDNGVPNTLLSTFSPLEHRSDRGALWENYLISERRKYLSNHGIRAHMYFWRTHSQQEIDYIEERDGALYAYEFKWSAHKRATIPSSFKEAYPSAIEAIITQENYDQFLLGRL